MTHTIPDVARHASEARESIRAINHTTPAVLPAPFVYDVLGELKGVGNMLPQALTQIAAGLGRSLDEFDMYEDDGSDPAQSVAIARGHLKRAAELASQFGDELEAAQSAISRQGYRGQMTGLAI